MEVHALWPSRAGAASHEKQGADTYDRTNTSAYHVLSGLGDLPAQPGRNYRAAFPEQLTLPAAPHEWTIEKLARQIIGNRVWWFQVWMGEGSPDLALSRAGTPRIER